MFLELNFWGKLILAFFFLNVVYIFLYSLNQMFVSWLSWLGFQGLFWPLVFLSLGFYRGLQGPLPLDNLPWWSPLRYFFLGSLGLLFLIISWYRTAPNYSPYFQAALLFRAANPTKITKFFYFWVVELQRSLFYRDIFQEFFYFLLIFLPLLEIHIFSLCILVFQDLQPLLWALSLSLVRIGGQLVLSFFDLYVYTNLATLQALFLA